jgi:hypothetical protein
MDLGHPEVLQLAVPSGRMKLDGKFLLQNAFFRWALAHKGRPRFIARMDDDAACNVTALAIYLSQFGKQHPALRYAMYGPFHNWYMWHKRSMQAVCISGSWRRWFHTQQAWAAQRGSLLPHPSVPITAHTRPVGPLYPMLHAQ